MKKIISTLSVILFILFTSFSLYAVAEKPEKIKEGKPEKVKAEIQHVYGEITKIDLDANTITIKQEDGTEITLKATTEKTQSMVKELKVGDKVKVGYIKSSEGDLVILKIIKPGEKGKEKPKKQNPNN